MSCRIPCAVLIGVRDVADLEQVIATERRRGRLREGKGPKGRPSGGH
jgi:hypothetical protein